MRVLILMLLPLVAADLYKETQDFQYSRSTDGESKQGYYGSQTGNMGGNYEVSKNMDNLAQNQMTGLMTQVGSQLGIDSSVMGKGYVPNSMNSGSVYGSASAHGKSSGVVTGADRLENGDQYDYDEAKRARGGYQTRYSGSSQTAGQRYNSGETAGRDRYVANENARSGSRQYGSSGRNEYSSYNVKGGSSSSSHYDTQNEHREGVKAVPTRVITLPNTRIVGVGRNLESDSHVTGSNTNKYVGSSSRTYGGSSMNTYGGTNRHVEDDHYAESLRGEQSNVEVNSESYFRQNADSRHKTASNVYDSYQTTPAYEDRVVPMGNNRFRVYLRPGDLVRVPIEMATPVQTRVVVNAHDTDEQSGVAYKGSRTLNTGHRMSGQRTHETHNSNYYKTQQNTNDEYGKGDTVLVASNPNTRLTSSTGQQVVGGGTHNTADAETTYLVSNPSVRTSSASHQMSLVRSGSRSTQNAHNTDHYKTDSDDNGALNTGRHVSAIRGDQIHNAGEYSNPSIQKSSASHQMGTVRSGSRTQESHNADYYKTGREDNLETANVRASNAGQVNADDYGNTGIYTTASKPKTYHSSYSYRKSWERQGTPYVIEPQEGVDVANNNDQASSASSSSYKTSSGYRSSKHGGSQSSYGQQGTEMGESGSHHSGSQAMDLKQMEEQLRNQMRAACPTCDAPKTKGYSASYSYSAQRRYGDDVDRQKRSAQEQQVEDFGQSTNDNYFSQQTENLEQQMGTFDQNQDSQLSFGSQGQETWVMEELNQQQSMDNLEQEPQLTFGSQGQETLNMEELVQQQSMDNLGQEPQLIFGSQGQESLNMKELNQQQSMGNLEQEPQLIFGNQGQEIQQQSIGNLEQEQQLTFGGQEQETEQKQSTRNLEQSQLMVGQNLEQKNVMIEQKTDNEEQKSNNDFELEYDGESRNVGTQPSNSQRGDIESVNVDAHLQDLLFELGNNHRTGKEERTANHMSQVQRLNRPYALSRSTTMANIILQDEPRSFLEMYPHSNQNEEDLKQISQNTDEISIPNNDFTQQSSNNEQMLQFDDLTQQQNSDWTQQSSNLQQAVEKDTIREVLQLSLQNQKITETTTMPTTTTAEPGFWSKVGNKIGNASDKVKTWIG